MFKILLLEDDLVISRETRDFLNEKGMECDAVFDGELFLKQVKQKQYDAFLLDINVPKWNGLDICKLIRETNKITPILMLTAFGAIEDKVDAFQLGADDYLVKPFHLQELFVRIQALLRRKGRPQMNNDVISIADLVIDLDEKTVTRNEQEIKLSPKEFKLLSILAHVHGRVLSKQQIAEKLWDYYIETNENAIEVYINFLRNKIDKQFEPKLLHTKVGYGYYLKAE
ncbi:MAG: response regulator transcription factor [bacterium]|nr:response regulator transcription factor [bacterium]